MREGKPRSIPRSKPRRCRFQINANAACGGQFTQHRKQQGPGPGAKIKHVQRRALIRAGIESGFHKGFAIGARDKRGGGDFQIKCPEPDTSGQVGEGFMRDTPCEQRCKMRGLIQRHGRARVTQQRFFGCAQYMRKQAARFQARGFNRGTPQSLPCLTEK